MTSGIPTDCVSPLNPPLLRGGRGCVMVTPMQLRPFGVVILRAFGKGASPLVGSRIRHGYVGQYDAPPLVEGVGGRWRRDIVIASNPNRVLNPD
jgi:hypothetical protein